MGNSLHTNEGINLVHIKNESRKDVQIEYIHPYKSSLEILLVKTGRKSCVETSRGWIAFLDGQKKPHAPYKEGKIIPKILVDNVTFLIEESLQGTRILTRDK